MNKNERLKNLFKLIDDTGLSLIHLIDNFLIDEAILKLQELSCIYSQAILFMMVPDILNQEVNSAKVVAKTVRSFTEILELLHTAAFNADNEIMLKHIEEYKNILKERIDCNNDLLKEIDKLIFDERE